MTVICIIAGFSVICLCIAFGCSWYLCTSRRPASVCSPHMQGSSAIHPHRASSPVKMVKKQNSLLWDDHTADTVGISYPNPAPLAPPMQPDMMRKLSQGLEIGYDDCTQSDQQP